MGDVLHNAEQIGTGGNMWPTNVVLTHPIELGQKRISLTTQIPLQGFLFIHGAILVIREGPMQRPWRYLDTPALVAHGTEHRFPKPIEGILPTKAKRLTVLQGLRFRLSSSQIISRVLTPVATQVRPKSGPELPQSKRERYPDLETVESRFESHGIRAEWLSNAIDDGKPLWRDSVRSLSTP
jgi:hypothetical protein